MNALAQITAAPSRQRSLADLIRTDAPRCYVEKMHAEGRVTDQTLRRYLLLWTWSASRFAGAAAEAQDRHHKRMGPEIHFRRIERAKRIARRIAEKYD